MAAEEKFWREVWDNSVTVWSIDLEDNEDGITTEKLGEVLKKYSLIEKNGAEAFHRKISKETALDLINVLPCANGKRGYTLKEELGIEVMCKEYGDDDDWVGIEASDYHTILEGDEYQTFEIWY